MRGRGRPPKLTGERRYPNRLRELRERCGVSQQVVAAAAAMSSAYYGALERGDKRINSDTAKRLAKALGCAAAALLGGAGGVMVPLVLAVAAAEATSRPADYDLPEPYEWVPFRRLNDAEDCVAAEVFDDSADIDFVAGTVFLLRRAAPLAAVSPGSKALVRFFLEPPGTGGNQRPTHEILYGILDRNIVGDLVLITRTRNRLIPRNLLIQNAAPEQRGIADPSILLPSRAEAIAYQPRAEDPAELLGIVIYAMGPI
jgi:transcriptional regulator with XRE-family HTH domain